MLSNHGMNICYIVVLTEMSMVNMSAHCVNEHLKQILISGHVGLHTLFFKDKFKFPVRI